MHLDLLAQVSDDYFGDVERFDRDLHAEPVAADPVKQELHRVLGVA